MKDVPSNEGGMASDSQLGGRRFYDIPAASYARDAGAAADDRLNPDGNDADEAPGEKLMRYIADNVVGNDATFSGPFGNRKVVYADYTASGRALSFIEKYVYQEILPYYGNTHTTSTVTSLQSTLFRHEARDAIRNSVNASEHDAVIFVSSGATGAVHKLINALRVNKRNDDDGASQDASTAPISTSPPPPPIVVAGPWEHHSNLLPWREVAERVVQVDDDVDGNVDLAHLRRILEQVAGTRRKGQKVVGCFSAASNVTGVKADVDAIAILLHRYDCLAFFDYATAAPHCVIDMNPLSAKPEDQPFVHKDAVFISTHKFVGGLNTPGVLVAKKKLFDAAPTPSEGGGGSVFFVTEQGHRYLQEVEMREEGGTPDIVGSIRAGLAFQLKDAVGTAIIRRREEQYVTKALEAWTNVPGLHVLGPSSADRLPVFSFMFSAPRTGLFLHHNYVSALLNDLFGIQSRGGCACAGPYAQKLMGMDFELASRFEDMLLEDQRLDRTHLRRYREYSQNEILRPGFVRLNLSFFASDDEINFLIGAVKWVAANAASLLPLYLFNRETGEWRHKDHQVFRDRRWMGHVSYASGEMTWRKPIVQDKGPLPGSLAECLLAADEVLRTELPRIVRRDAKLGEQNLLFSGEADSLRWFLLPSEALRLVGGKGEEESPFDRKSPFVPVVYHRATASSRRNEADSIELAETIETTTTTTTAFTASAETDPSSSATLVKESIVAANQTVSPLDDPVRFIPLYSKSKKKRRKGDALTKREGTVRIHEEVTTSTTTNGPTTETMTMGESKIDGADIDEKTEASNGLADGSSSPICPTGACPRLLNFQNGKACRRRQMTDMPSAVKPRWFSPGKKLYKPTAEAIEAFDMIHDGDRVLVCLSGGKDSLSLLHTLRQFQFVAKSRGVSFDLGALTVDPLSASYDPSPLVPYLRSLGVPYLYEEQDILGQAAAANPVSICSFCSRMKRGRIYSAARREGYNVLAFGQHLDDLAESFLMSIFHNGLLRTMKANYRVGEGDLRLIRPFVFVREKDTREFAEKNKLPVIPENCPACFEAPKERHRFKQLLASQELLFPDVYSHLSKAMHPLIAVKTNVANMFVDNTFPDDIVDE